MEDLGPGVGICNERAQYDTEELLKVVDGFERED